MSSARFFWGAAHWSVSAAVWELRANNLHFWRRPWSLPPGRSGQHGHFSHVVFIHRFRRTSNRNGVRTRRRYGAVEVELGRSGRGLFNSHAEPAEWLLLLAHEDGRVAACQPLAGDGASVRVRVKVPKRMGRRTLAASIRALDRRGIDSPMKLLFYEVGRQVEE